MYLQMADIMTKGLVKDKFVPLQDKLMGWEWIKLLLQKLTFKMMVQMSI